MKRSLCFIAFAIASCGSDPAGSGNEPDPITPTGDAAVVGRALDSNGAGVPNARVLIQSDPIEVATDPNGAFAATVPAGEHHLTVTKHGVTFIDMVFTIEPEEPLDLGDIDPDLPFVYSRMALRETGYANERFHSSHTTCAITIEDDVGRPIHGLEVDDFVVTERVVSKSDGSIAGEEVMDLPTQVADGWQEAGVWEHSRNRTMIDLVVLMDATGSMDPHVNDIKASMHNLVDLMVANHVDFRVGGAIFNSVPVIAFNQTFGFYGDQEIDRLRAGIDNVLHTAGEGWNPTTAYDALMLTEWLGFREDARKVVVILTDIVPTNVYGTHWYAPSASVATASAAEIFSLEQGIELYFSQNPAEHTGIDSFTLADRNPRAGDARSGLRGLASRGFATDLGWPFDEAAFWLMRLSPAITPLVDAQYLVSWETSLGWELPWRNDPAAYEVRVTVEIDDPIIAGETLSASFILPTEVMETAVTINIITEEDNDPDMMRADIWRLGGRRPVTQTWQLPPTDGLIELALTPGRYSIEVYDGGRHSFDDTSLRAVARDAFEVGSEPVSLDVVVPLSDTRAALARARGLLRDLDDWRISGDPFREFCEESERWLTDLEAGGFSWEEMTTLRRFNVALAGYANITEYAQIESASAVEDMIDIVHDFAEVIKEVKELKKTTEDEWYIELLGELLEAAYAILTRGEFNAKKVAVEEGFLELIKYAGGRLIDELQEHVVLQFPNHPDAEMFTPMVQLFFASITYTIRSGSSDSEPDWRPIAEAAQTLTLDIALTAVRHKIGPELFEEIIQDIPVDDEYQDAIKDLVVDILNALARRNHDMKDFQRAIEAFAKNLGGAMVQDRGREQVIADVNAIFDRIQQRLGGYPEVRDFLVGFARDMTIEAVPEFINGRPHYEIKKDRVVAILIEHALYNVILRRYYADKVSRALNRTLASAKAFQLPPGTPSDWESAMSNDFWDYRSTVGAEQGPVWSALAVQDTINDWALGLAGLVKALQAISVPLDFVAALYPPLQDTAQRLHGFIAVLDGIKITSQAIEFGLKVESLGDLGNVGKTLYTEAYPH